LIYGFFIYRLTMNKPPLTLHLVVPGLLGPMPALNQTVGDLRLPNLERLLSRSRQTTVPETDLESVLFGFFGIKREPASNLPAAAYRRIGDGGVSDDRYWLQVSPVYLRPDQDRLLVFDVEDLHLTATEATDLAEQFNAHFTEEGWQVEVLDPHRWYLPLESAPELKTHELTDVFGRNMDLFLPEGPDSIKWHGILNEIQMLFYTSAINDQRESEGKGAVSGLWLSGGGNLAENITTPLTGLYGKDSLLKGLAKSTGLAVDDRPFDTALLDGLSGEVLVHMDQLQRAVLCADPISWREEITAIDAWMISLLESIKNGAITQLNLHTCNGQLYSVDKSALRRFWKRSRSITEQLDSNTWRHSQK